MSRYRATTGELLEQIRQEAKTKDIYNMAFAGDNANTIAKKLKLDVTTVKKVLGERFSMSDFKSNEKDNKHSENAYELAKQFGTRQEVERMEQILKFIKQRGYVDKVGYDMGIKITKKYASKLEAYREVQEEILNEYNPNFGKDTSAGRTKETHAADKKTKDEDRVKSLENEIQRLKLELENEKNATVKPEPNPDTGEVPLTVGIAHKYIKDKQDKKEVKKEELEEVFSKSQIDRLKKQYEPLRNKRINPTNLMKVFDKIDHDKNTLIQLYKSNIPFVSTLAGSRLSQKHNLSPMDIKKIISKEEVQEEVELTEYFATVHSDKKQIADFIKKNKSGIDYVDDDAGGNIEFEGKGAHELADKVKAKFGVRVTKESFEPIEDKSLDEMSLPSMNVPMTVQYTYIRNPHLFMQILKGTKTGKKMKHVFPRKMGSGEYILRGTGEDHIDFLKTLNSKGVMPKNKILGEELEEDTNKYITEKIKGLENKAKKTGMPYSILKKVYDRGMAAWKGGHRPGAGQQQWAFARVNSFVTKSSGTWGKADKDLAAKVRASESLEETRQLKDKEKEMMVVKDGKVIVIDKSDYDKYKAKGYIQAEDTENEACWDTHKQVGTKMKGGKRVPNCVPKNEELEESTKVEGGPPTDGGPGSGAHNHDNKPSSRFDKVPNVKSFGKNLKGVTGVRQNGSRLEFDSNDGTATAREILKKFGKGKVKVTSIPDDDDPEMKSTVVVTPVKEEIEESAASDQAKSMGLTYLKFGRYGKNGKVTHKSDGGALRKFDPKTGKMGDKETKGTDDPKSLSSKEKEQEVQKLKDKIGLYKKDGSPSAGKLAGIIKRDLTSGQMPKVPGFIEYDYPSSDTLKMDADEADDLVKELKKKFGDALKIDQEDNFVTVKVKDFDDIKENMDDYMKKKYGYTDVSPSSKLTPAQKKFQNLLKKLDKDRQSKKAAYLKNEKEEVQEANLTDKQVDMVKKVADKLPKDDFKKRYGKDADNVKFGTATNIVKKKLNIDGYDGARNLVDRLLKKEKGDE